MGGCNFEVKVSTDVDHFPLGLEPMPGSNGPVSDGPSALVRQCKGKRQGFIRNEIKFKLTQDVVRLDVRVNNVRLLHELEAQQQLLRVGSEI